MSTLTSSAINKSGKTVAPKAAARRRAPQRPPPASTPSSQPVASVAADEHVAATESDAVAGAADESSLPTPVASQATPTNAEQSVARERSVPRNQPALQLDEQIAKDVAPTARPLTPPPTQQIDAPDIQQALEDTQDALLDARIPADTTQAIAPPQQDASSSAPEIVAATTAHEDQVVSRTPPRVGGSPSTSTRHTPAADFRDDDASLASSVATGDGVAHGPRQASPQTAGVKRKRAQPRKDAQPQVTNEVDPLQSSQIAQDTTALPLATTEIANVPAQQPADETSARTAAPAPKPRKPRQRKTVGSVVATTEREEPVPDVLPPDATQKSNPKPRAKRKPKSAARVVEDGEEDGDAVAGAAAEDSAPKPKKRRRTRQATTEPQGETQGGTPTEDIGMEDPELHEIDPHATTMADLTRDKRLGKSSEREAKMAAIDWTEVNRKRREGETTAPTADGVANGDKNGDGNADGQDGETPAAVPTPRPLNPPPQTGPRLRIVNGDIVIDEESLRVDRQAQAALDAAGLQPTEDNDLTERVNKMSWINDKKREPSERVPFFKMKSDPWSDEETDRFYDALRMFGTDFFIISKMFPPKTRRQIKLKFIREERLDPPRINTALAGGESVPMSLATYAEATGQELDDFRDPRELEEELRQEGEEQRGEIEKKRVETAEAQKQRDIVVASREKDRAEREVQKQAQKEERAAIRARKRKGQFGTGTL